MNEKGNRKPSFLKVLTNVWNEAGMRGLGLYNQFNTLLVDDSPHKVVAAYRTEQFTYVHIYTLISLQHFEFTSPLSPTTDFNIHWLQQHV